MTHDAKPVAFGTLTIVLTLLAWSSIPLFLRHFVDLIDPWTSNGWRYGFSALLWAPVLVIALLRRRLRPGLWKAAIVPSIVNAIGQVTFVCAHYQIEPGLLSFGLRSQIIFAAVGAYLLFPNERRVIRSRSYVLGVLAVMGGTSGALLMGQQRPDGGATLGILLAIVSGLFFALYALSVRKYMRDRNSVVAFAMISQYTAAAMVVLMLLFGRRSGVEVIELPRSEFALLLLSAVIGIAFGHVLYYMSIARLGVAVSAGVLQLHPFVVAIASFLLFAEVLTTAQWISGSVAIAGAVLMLSVQRNMARDRRSKPDEPDEAPLAGTGSDA